MDLTEYRSAPSLTSIGSAARLPSMLRDSTGTTDYPAEPFIEASHQISPMRHVNAQANHPDEVPVSRQALYDRLKHIELPVSAALVRYIRMWCGRAAGRNVWSARIRRARRIWIRGIGESDRCPRLARNDSARAGPELLSLDVLIRGPGLSSHRCPWAGGYRNFGVSRLIRQTF
jgi:hypothetical protein